MNYKELLNRTTLLISSPAKAWEGIVNETNRKAVMGEFVYPMIGLCGLSVFIGTFIGNTAGVSAFQIAMTRCCATFVSLFGGFFLASYLTNLLGKQILGKEDELELNQQFPALLGQRLYPRAKSLYALFYLVIPNVIFLLLDSASAGKGIAVAGGTALGLLLGKLRAFSYRSEGDAGENGGAKLAMAAEVLELLRRQLPRATAPACIGEAESVFDGAAERVCRCCERFHRCWQHRAVETYEALSSAARPMIERGVAQSEDLPPAFRDRCCHLEGFVTAINQELEGMLFRRRYRMQLEESRQVVSQQLECLAEYLQATREERLPLHKKRAVYLPRVGICTIGKNGSPINGDQGACFAGMDTDYYVLLCDGMGTGSWAQRMCTETVNLLERLLRSGLAPQSALKLLNGMELLRGDDRFTTVDLLHLRLSSGEAVLYKWGSAPSYWRRDEETKKIGTASPPPGVGVGGEHAPERYELSLKEGELLVLTSDGAGEEELETAISMYSGTSPQELAALLISGKTAQDDMSAVVISLQPYAS